MPLQEEPTVESLSREISELQRVVRDLQAKVEKLSGRSDISTTPQTPSPGSIGEKNFTIGQRAVNPHSNEDIMRITYEK